MKFRLPNRSIGTLGVAPDKREYDLPFNADSAGRFLVLLIGLMTYLALLSGAAGMVLTGMANRWTAGLANHVTIEIPVLKNDGTRLSEPEHQEKIKAIASLLRAESHVTGLEIQQPADVGKLVEPWLGAGDQVLGQIPLPALISVTMDTQDSTLMARLKKSIVTITPEAMLETHESWLNDVLRLTSTLSFAAYLIGFITAITTVSAVGGAVRARMAAYREQLEILHLIGASDEYITRQFQKHALQISFIGTGGGFLMAMLTLMIIDRLAGTVELSLVPSLVLSGFSFFILLAIPVLTCLITVFTTRITVLQSLQDMP